MSETDRRLKDHLNTNQVMRERMCLELLQTQPKFSEVLPRLPKGGPDGGRDIEATYDEERLVFGAVGFFNDATDLDEHRRAAEKKFLDDLQRAKEYVPENKKKSPSVFVFFTNVCLTPTIIDRMKKAAYVENMIICEVYDRERLRILLDSNNGYAIRQRYLDIPLSDAEQKEFFSAWGDRLQDMMTSRLEGIDALTKRVQFLLEAEFLVDSIYVTVRLDKSLNLISGGNFVFQTTMFLRLQVDGLTGFTFGSGNNNTFDDNPENIPTNTQYGYAFASIMPDSTIYERYKSDRGEIRGLDYSLRTLQSSGELDVSKNYIYTRCGSEPFIDRFSPTCRLLDMHGCSILFDCTKEVADHIEEIKMYANQYEILVLGKNDIKIEEGEFRRLLLPIEAPQTEEFSKWCVIRPSKPDSCFDIDFDSRTPRRFFNSI